MRTRLTKSPVCQGSGSPADEVGAVQSPQRIYIDCTSTYATGLNTGIQRVVRALVEREQALTQHTGIPCIPVIAFRGRFWPFSRTQRAFVGDTLAASTKSRKTARGCFVRIERSVLALGSGFYVPRAIMEAGFRFVRYALTRLFSRIQAIAPLWAFRHHKVRAIQPTPRDLLFIADKFWGEHGQLCAIERFAAAGGAVVPVIYDVVPLTHPTYFPNFNVRPFAQGIMRILTVACGVLTISRTVMSDVGRYCAEQGYGHIPLDYAYCGADIAQPSRNPTESVRLEVVAYCQTQPFLMVGTIEPRKGYQTALDAYETYQQTGGRRPLIIVGRLGFEEFDIVARIQKVAAKSGSIIFYHDASDAELVALYQHASALIFASFYEGFGLPLVEAMHQGLPVIASDIPVFQEIGQDYPAYFRVGDVEDLCRVLREHDVKGDNRKMPRPWPTWNEAAQSYIEKAIALYARAHTGK